MQCNVRYFKRYIEEIFDDRDEIQNGINKFKVIEKTTKFYVDT